LELSQKFIVLNEWLDEHPDKNQAGLKMCIRAIKPDLNMSESKDLQEYLLEQIDSKQLFSDYLSKSQNLSQAIEILQHHEKIRDIESSYQACVDASNWLSSERIAIIISNSRRNILREQNIHLDAEKKNATLSKLEVSIVWINHYLAKGIVPIPFPWEMEILDSDNSTLLKELQCMYHNEVTEHQGISAAAAYELRGYIDRFLIQPLINRIS
jgi:hypothetical protein